MEKTLFFHGMILGGSHYFPPYFRGVPSRHLSRFRPRGLEPKSWHSTVLMASGTTFRYLCGLGDGDLESFGWDGGEGR